MSEGRRAVSAESGGAGNNNFAIAGRQSSDLVGGVVHGSVIAQHRSDPIHVVEGEFDRRAVASESLCSLSPSRLGVSAILDPSIMVR